MAIYDKQSIPTHLHQKMKILAKNRGNRPIIREYETALENHIAQQNQDILLADSKIEKLMNERLSKMEERFAGLMARIGMDTNIAIIALLHSLSKRYNIPENELYDQFRPAAAKLFSRSYKDKG
jgi:hypothetical protein